MRGDIIVKLLASTINCCYNGAVRIDPASYRVDKPSFGGFLTALSFSEGTINNFPKEVAISEKSRYPSNLKIHNLVSKNRFLCARELRNNQTPAEKKLWSILRRKSLGVKFGRQRVIRGYIVDFYCPQLRLVIEVDGAIHSQQKEKDSFRDDVIKSLGFEVFRFSNEDILKNISMVIEKIKEGINGNN